MQLLQLSRSARKTGNRRPGDWSLLQTFEFPAFHGCQSFLRCRLTESERGHCAYFAAVALERRISFSRDMLAPAKWTPEVFLSKLGFTACCLFRNKPAFFARLTFRAYAILRKFPPHRSGCVRSAKLNGDKNMLAVWRGIAVKRTRL